MKFRLLILPAILFLSHGNTLRAQIITTIAGSNIFGFSGAGGPATSAKMGQQFGIAVDNAGNVYSSDEDNNVIWKTSNTGIISIYAGTGTAGYSGDGGPAAAALLNTPFWMSTDPSGNLYFIDDKGVYIRKINAAGIISTYAGNPAAHFSAGDGDPPSPAMKKFLFVSLIYCLGCLSSAAQCLIPGGSGDTVTPVTGNFLYDSTTSPKSDPTMAVVIVDSVSKTLITPKAWKINGYVRASVSDDHGGFYIGGDFTQIGDISRSHIVISRFLAKLFPKQKRITKNDSNLTLITNDLRLAYFSRS